MIYGHWKEEYLELLEKFRSSTDTGKSAESVTFELIQHWFIPATKKFIQERFPNTSLDMDESKCTLKWRKFRMPKSNISHNTFLLAFMCSHRGMTSSAPKMRENEQKMDFDYSGIIINRLWTISVVARNDLNMAYSCDVHSPQDQTK